jgi:hypothetical protein
MMEHCSVIKKKTMSFAGKWMELEIIVFRYIRQTEKEKYHVISHMWNLAFKNE